MPILTGAGPVLIALGGLAAFIGYRKDDTKLYNELVGNGMPAPDARPRVDERHERLMTKCLMAFGAGVLVSIAAVVGSVGLF